MISDQASSARRGRHRRRPAHGRPRRWLGTALVVVVGAVGGLTACAGEGGSSPSTTVPPVTSSTTSTTIPADPEQAAFVALVNPICAARNQKIQDAAAGLTVPETAAALAKRARFSIEASEKIRAITAPPGDEATVAAMLAAMDQINQDTAALSEAVLYADPVAGRTAAEALTQAMPPLNAQLAAYGLGDCVLEAPTS